MAIYLKDNPVSNILITGQAGQSIRKMLQYYDYQGAIFEFDDMRQAFNIMKDMARANQICLLSPAAASYDKYVNFEERGRIFKDFARNFKSEKQ